jgi:hypothetical protein
MNFADAAPQPSDLAPWAVLCGGLSCLFVTSLVVLIVVMVRRSKRKA